MSIGKMSSDPIVCTPEIADEVQAQPEPQAEPPVEVAPQEYNVLDEEKTSKSKFDVVQDVNRARQLAGLEPMDEKHLNRKSKKELNAMLAELLTHGAGGSEHKPPVNPPSASRPVACALSDEKAGEVLANMNLAMAWSLQKLNNEFNPYVEIDGWDRRLLEQKQELAEAYAEIYRSNKNALAPLLDPKVRLLYINVSSALSCAKSKPQPSYPASDDE